MVFKSDRQRRAVMARLSAIQRVRAIKVVQSVQGILKSDLKKVTKKKDVKEIRENLRESDQFIKRLKTDKPLSNKELRDLKEVSAALTEAKITRTPFGPIKAIVTATRPIKLEKDVTSVLNRRVRRQE